ncbi:MAG: tol-pal system protein YbgF [Thermodesulfobacteriota bacterium]
MLLEETQLMEGNLRTLDWMKRWIILVLVVLFFGCATSEDVRILDEDIRRFQSQLNLMQKDEDALKRELSAFQKKNQEDISALQTETKRLQTDLPLRLENLQSEMRILSTGVEEYKEFLKKPSREIDRVKEDIGSRTKVLEERGKTFEEKNRTLEDQTKALGEKIKGIEDRFKGLEEKITGLASKLTEMEKPPPTKEVPAEVKGVSTNVGDLYKDAYETFQKGNLEGARRKFEAFLKQYPNTELSDNAQFWIGETYFLKKDFEKAILEYEKAIVKYPEGDKIPAALFKQALAFLELGDKTNARNLLKRVIERYPHSEQAEMAKKRLEGIK